MTLGVSTAWALRVEHGRPLMVEKPESPAVATEREEKALKTLLTVEHHTKLGRGIAFADVGVTELTRSVGNTPEWARWDARQVLATNLPEEESSEGPSTKQRVDEQRNLTRRPDVRALKVGDEERGPLLGTGRTKDVVKTLGVLVVNFHFDRGVADFGRKTRQRHSGSNACSCTILAHLPTVDRKGADMHTMECGGGLNRERDESLHQLKEIVRQRDRLDDVLVALVVPFAGDELHGPGAGQGPAAERGAVTVLLYDVEVALVAVVGETEPAGGYGHVLEPGEEVAVLGRAALERDVREGQLLVAEGFPGCP